MQPGFFDDEDRLAKLEKLGDSLPRLDSIVEWQAFRPLLKFIHQKQRIDASLVNVPKNRNTRDENKQIQEGKTPDSWEEQPTMRKQKHEDAR